MSLRRPPLRLLLSLIALLIAGPAQAQLLRLKPREAGPPPGTPPSAAEIWPFPPPDPKTWWTDKRPAPPEAADPLGGRRLRRGEQTPRPENGVDPSTYRLWGLPPLQWQVLRGDELILEVWTRPTNSVRQTVTRIVLRDDGEGFVQARAGLACCEASIGRRVGFDASLPRDAIPGLRALRAARVWTSPRDVRSFQPGMTDPICVQGTAYDLTLAERGRTLTRHRACDSAEVGEAADVLERVLAAALRHEPRFDALFPGGADFASAREDYTALLAAGGGLKPNPDARSAPPGAEGAPTPEP